MITDHHLASHDQRLGPLPGGGHAACHHQFVQALFAGHIQIRPVSFDDEFSSTARLQKQFS